LVTTHCYNLLDHKNEDIVEELKTEPVERKSEHHKQKWLIHVSNTEDIRYQKQIIIDLSEREDLDDH